ncbi:MAG: phosphotransferase, partial [Planctomycetota bacterium]|nr:phosphotransferase [Planctomycetota bacterium]
MESPWLWGSRLAVCGSLGLLVTGLENNRHGGSLLTDLISSQPDLLSTEVADFVESHFGLKVGLEPLDSERDQNFLATELSGGQKYVVKIGNSKSDLSFIELENEAMLRLAATDLEKLVPQPILGTRGKPVAFLENQEARFPVRVVQYIPGELLANVYPQTEGLLFDLGSVLGKVAAAFDGFQHSAAQREFHWDLDRVLPTLTRYREFSEPCREIDVFLDRYQARVLPRLESLRKSIIHNDANDHNVIVNPRGEPVRKIAGLIDFGDMVFASTVNELAIAMAYVMLNTTDPVRSASCVVQGFHENFALADEEIDVVFDLACMRLCSSVVIAGYQRSLNPENHYLSVTDLPAQQRLKTLAQVDSEFAACVFRSVCQKPASPKGKRIESFLKREGPSFHPVLGFPLVQ